ncbi:MAG: thiamine-phosphate kinase [Phycisphaerae bacterium]
MAVPDIVTIRQMKESEFLKWVYEKSRRTPAVPVPVGDDMAAIRLPHRSGKPLTLLKIDQCLDQVHFDLRYHAPGLVGRKAVNRCLSDCAAMAALPVAILIAVALPEDVSLPWARKLYLGCESAAKNFNCALVGGDTAIWNQRLAITVAAFGLPRRRPVLRSGARPGDVICVTGSLGGSIRGRHLTFTPRIALAQRLIEITQVHAMMDISDGLAIDLPRMLAMSDVGAEIDGDCIPIHPDARRLARSDDLTPLHHALCDGEDYELLFTVAPRDAARLAVHRLPIHTIGRITRVKNNIEVTSCGRRIPWPTGGWNHGANRPR